jgi:hypothetical protein
MIFQSTRSFYPADGAVYAALKHLQILHLENDALHPLTSVAAPFNLSPERWASYDGPRLLAAARGERGTLFASPFPGHTLPGPGANTSTVRRHSLMIDWHAHLSTLTPLPCPTDHHWSTEGLGDSIERIHLESSPSPKALMTPLKEGAFLAHWHGRSFRNIARLIQHAWDAHDHTEPSDDLVTKLGALIDHVRTHVEDPLAFLFEAYDLLRRAEASNDLGIELIGMGIYEGNWLDVGLLPLEAIHPTELVVTMRIVMELEALTTRGFAPIVVNEFGCNTDGSHRQTACAFWNACACASRMKDTFQTRIEHGLRSLPSLKPLIARELRRLAQEIDRDPELSARVAEATKGAQMDRRLTHVPVMLVPEYSAGTVVKGPYDRGEASLRVCPQLYKTMAEDGRLTLPARGPYHGTDRALAPWFHMF